MTARTALFVGKKDALHALPRGLGLALVAAGFIGFVSFNPVAGGPAIAGALEKLPNRSTSGFSFEKDMGELSNGLAGLPAKPFYLAGGDPVSQSRARRCLAEAVYYEAGTESEVGQLAVAQVVLNRVRHPIFPSTICGVVYQGSTRSTGCQFTFTCDGSLSRVPVGFAWRRAISVADRALSGEVSDRVGFATHYHATWMTPYWSSSVERVAKIGGHMFYRWRGNTGRESAFSQAYAGVESPPATIFEAPEPIVSSGVIQNADLRANSSEEAPKISLADGELISYRGGSNRSDTATVDEQALVGSLDAAIRVTKTTSMAK